MTERTPPDPGELTDVMPLPTRGRVVRRQRPVRVADTSPGGRLRLDAIARHLQDVSADDTAEVELPGKELWVVRRLVLEVLAFPVLREVLTLATWCGGIGSHYAERRVSVVGGQGGRVEGSALWVHIDADSGRPKRLPPEFAAVYGDAAGGGRARARLQHSDPPPQVTAAASTWPLRFTDFDVLGHVNNSVYWSPVEEVLAERRDLRAPLRAVMEHRGALEPTSQAGVAVDQLASGGFALWVLDVSKEPATVAASATVTPLLKEH